MNIGPSECPACRGAGTPEIGEKNGYPLRQCGECRTAFVSPMPAGEVLDAFYSRYAKTPKYLRKQEKKVARAKLRLRFLPVRRGMRFLDVGCNAGFAVKAALDRGLDARGIDIDREAIATAQSWLPPDRFEAASVEDYAARGHRADFIYSSEVLEHVPDPDRFAAALRDVLVPGGRLYITCPDAGHWLRPRNFLEWQAVRPPEHLVYYTRAGLRALFARHGFGRIRFRPHTKPSHRMTARAE
ncbi:MAG: class I SAM-dependent methyltransferase [Alphaproteobacteria bacterium]